MPPFLYSILTHLRYLYLSNRFFIGLAIVVVLATIGFWYATVFWLAVALLLLLVALSIVDVLLLYRSAGGVTAVRQPPEVFSLGDTLPVRLLIDNRGPYDLAITLTDELPAQLQLRNQRLPLSLAATSSQSVAYRVRPTSRGAYRFGDLNLFLRTTRIGLAERRLRIAHEQTVAVYPSIVQMKQFGLRARAARSPRRGGDNPGR